jgi:hypothetical protein
MMVSVWGGEEERRTDFSRLPKLRLCLGRFGLHALVADDLLAQELRQFTTTGRGVSAG